MAKQREVFEDEKPVGIINEVQEEAAKFEKERKLKNGKRDFDARLKKMEDLLSQAYEEYGPDHYITQIFMNFYDMFVQLKETIHLITGINTVTEVLFETISFFDESFKYQNELMEGSLKTKYGLFTRLKERRRARKVARNISGRMKVLTGKISSLQGISTTMVTSLRRATDKMTKTMNKQKIKADKQAQKDKERDIGSTSANLSEIESPSSKFLKAKFGEKPNDSASPDSASNSATTPNSGSAYSAGDIDW